MPLASSVSHGTKSFFDNNGGLDMKAVHVGTAGDTFFVRIMNNCSLSLNLMTGKM